MFKNGGNFCHKLDFAAATLAETLMQASSKAGRMGSAYIVRAVADLGGLGGQNPPSALEV